MKPITLPPILILGCLALTGGLGVWVGSTGGHSCGQIPADWWTCVYLETLGQTPMVTFAVPPDRYLVVTMHFRTNATLVQANGENRTFDLEPLRLAGDGHWPDRHKALGDLNGTRVVFQPGALLTVTPVSDPQGRAWLWGYLEPVR